MKINDEEFVELISELEEFAYKGDKPCIIKFGNTHCAPCLKMDPVIKKLEELQDGYLIYSVDTDESPETCNTIGIMSTPTTLFIRTDGEVDMMIGFMSEQQILDKIKEFFK